MCVLIVKKYYNHGLPEEDSKFRLNSFESLRSSGTWNGAVNAFSADLSTCCSSLVLLDDGGVCVSEVSPPPIWPSVVEVVLSGGGGLEVSRKSGEITL